MPCAEGILFEQDAAPGYVGSAHPVDWVDFAGSEILGIAPRSAMQGQPPPLSWWQRRMRLGPETQMLPAVPVFIHHRPYNRGAAAYTPKFGVVASNPIGAGVFAPYRPLPSYGPSAQYQAGAIWFDVQAIPTSMRMGRSTSMESVDALLAHSYVAAGYQTTG